MNIDISKYKRSDVLIALYNNAKPQGRGFFHYDATPMLRDEAASLLSKYSYFDYLKGRVMKVDLSKDEFDPRFYDRDNGEGAAQAAIDQHITEGG